MTTHWLPSGPLIKPEKVIHPPYPDEWYDFIEQHPDLSPLETVPRVVVMTRAKFIRLAQVNALVNNLITYRKDTKDSWREPETEGDCEDYAIAKMAKLIKHGWPRGALRLAVCKFWKIGKIMTRPSRWVTHAVLHVDTDHGTWVLDNRHTFVKRYRMLHYIWQYREGIGPMDGLHAPDIEIRGFWEDLRNQQVLT